MTNEETTWRFLKRKGLSDFAVAGIMGNLNAESSIRPNNLQDSFQISSGYTDESYTRATDDGTYTNFVQDGAGYGIAQWTWWSRKKALLELAKTSGRSVGDIEVQLEYLWKELKEYPTLLNKFEYSYSVHDATVAFLLGFERPADISVPVQQIREAYGRRYYDMFSGIDLKEKNEKDKEINVTKVLVKIEDLNIRKGPGIGYARTGKYATKGKVNIVEREIGAIDYKGMEGYWGKLETGEGWICLGYSRYTEDIS